MPREELTTYYEELRTQALAATGRGLGLTLFLREGMYSWMCACARSIALAHRNMADRVVAVGSRSGSGSSGVHDAVGQTCA